MAYTTDPIADLLTRIRNAERAGHPSVELASSQIKVEILKVLKREGFIQGFDVVEKEPQNDVRIELKYGPRREHVITNLKRISKPGMRVYCSHQKTPRVLRGLGIAIISTSRGIMTDREARKAGLGGEVLCHVW